MTRNDYERIAKAIESATNGQWSRPDPSGTDFQRGAFWTLQAAADVMEADNSRFNRKLFYRACGVPEGAADIPKPYYPRESENA